MKKNRDGSATITALAAGKATIVATDAVTKKSASIEIEVSAEVAAVPSKFVGVFEGSDGVGSTLSLRISADGSGTLSHLDMGLDYAVSFVSSNGDAATFLVDIEGGLELILETNGSTYFVTMANGDYVEAADGGYFMLGGEGFDKVA